MDGRAVGVIEGGTLYYVRTDWIGRPSFATNSSGTRVWEATYLPFGGVHTSTGTPLELRFPGQWFQSESGLHQNWMRDYDPTTGRYIQADPLGLVDGASVYNYALQNPRRYVDPRGEFVASSKIPPPPRVDDDVVHCAGRDCAEEWREAYNYCASILSQQNPPRGLTGGHTTIHECAKGFVSEACKGNEIDWGPNGPPPGWRATFWALLAAILVGMSGPIGWVAQ